MKTKDLRTLAVKRAIYVNVAAIRALTVGVTVVWAAAFGVGQNPAGFSAQVDSYMRAYVNMGDFSGNLLIVKAGKVLARKSYGKANYELAVPNSAEGRFQLLSVTKTFTAGAVVLLAQRGKIRISDPLSLYIPEFPNGKGITLEQLLTHTSGVPDYYSFPDYQARKTIRLSIDEMIKWIASFPLDFEPGSRESYSNSGYALLAAVIQKASGQSYCDFLAYNIFVPLNMHQTGCYTDQDLITDRVTGYNDWLGTPGLRNIPYYSKSQLIGSGNLYSSVGDLYLWYQALRNKTLFDITLAAAYGWGDRVHEGHPFIEQSGRNRGFVALIDAYFKDDLCIILLGNIEVQVLESMSADLASLVFGKPVKTPTIRPTFKANQSHLQDFVGRYMVRDGFFLDVKRSEDHLYLRGTGGSFLPLYPVGNDEFFYKQLYVTIRFRRGEDRKIDAVRWNGDYVCKRVADTPDLSYGDD